MRRTLIFLTTFIATATVLLFIGCGGNKSVKLHNNFTRTCPDVKSKDAHGNSFMQCKKGAKGSQTPSRLRLQAGGGGTALDFGWGGPSASCFPGAGASGAISYLSYTSSKNWARWQIDNYHANGIKTAVIWETSASRATAGKGAGQSDAYAALGQARALGLPENRPIYFAIDSDVSGGSVSSYFYGVSSVLGVNRTGAYGGYTPISYLFNHGQIRYGWQTLAWSYGALDGRAQLFQRSIDINYCGSSVDFNTIRANDWGQWPIHITPPGPSHQQIVTWIKGKRAAKNEWFHHNCGKHPIDNPCPHLRRLVSAYQGQLEVKAKYPHVYAWGPKANTGEAISQVVRPTYAAWLRAAASSRQQYWGNKCQKHPRRGTCPVWAQRTQYFNGHAKSLMQQNKTNWK